jgi:hypothetical protein
MDRQKTFLARLQKAKELDKTGLQKEPFNGVWSNCAGFVAFMLGGIAKEDPLSPNNLFTRLEPNLHAVTRPEFGDLLVVWWWRRNVSTTESNQLERTNPARGIIAHVGIVIHEAPCIVA